MERMRARRRRGLFNDLEIIVERFVAVAVRLEEGFEGEGVLPGGERGGENRVIIRIVLDSC